MRAGFLRGCIYGGHVPTFFAGRNIKRSHSTAGGAAAIERIGGKYNFEGGHGGKDGGVCYQRCAGVPGNGFIGHRGMPDKLAIRCIYGVYALQPIVEDDDRSFADSAANQGATDGAHVLIHPTLAASFALKGNHTAPAIADKYGVLSNQGVGAGCGLR